MPGRRWTRAEEDVVRAGRAKGLVDQAIAAMLPGRSAEAVTLRANRYLKLQHWRVLGSVEMKMRLPATMLEEIQQRAQAEGMFGTQWVRNLIMERLGDAPAEARR